MTEFSELMRSPRFISAYTRLESSGTEAGIILVEDASDRNFWERVVRSACPGRYSVKPYGEPGSGGKRRLEQLYKDLHPGLLVAVDSDFDYLCPGRNPSAVRLNNSPYILHTFFYSRESYLATPEATEYLTDSIHFYVATDHELSEAIAGYSETIYEAVVLFAWLHNRDQQGVSESEFNSSLRLPDGIRLLDENLRVNPEALTRVRCSAAIWMETHRARVNDEQDFALQSGRLNARGIFPRNAALFISGHRVLNEVYRPMYKLYLHQSRKNDTGWVRDRIPEAQRQDRLNQLRGHYETRCHPETLLHHCDAFRETSEWKAIVAKLSATGVFAPSQ